ncbi:hypothetical protein Hanom_Chr08g00699981 [Helianthus anomalus]
MSDGGGSDRRSSGGNGDARFMVLTKVVFGGSSLGLFRVHFDLGRFISVRFRPRFRVNSINVILVRSTKVNRSTSQTAYQQQSTTVKSRPGKSLKDAKSY